MNIYTKLTLLCLFLIAISGSALAYLVMGAYNSSITEGLSSQGSIDSGQLIASVQANLTMPLILVIIGTIIFTLIGSYIFVKPILKLSKMAKNLGEGKFDSNIEDFSDDELGTLANQLNKTSKVLVGRLDDQKKMNQKLEEQKDEIARQKEQIEKSNLEMTDSISYARRIQNSILPQQIGIKRVVKDMMVYYQPKDIVSGDFYWFERVRKGRNDFLVIACADCTGHGVPGAIMSIMGSNQLTNIVYYQNYLDPDKILARLDKAIKFELYTRDEKEASRKDGMEIGICTINLDDNVMEFSGAGIPLYRMRKGELDIFRSIREMVGGMEGEEREVEARLNKEKIEIKPGDRFYLATDGFQDQFGGKEDKKFMARNFRRLMLEYVDLPLKEQEEKFKKEFLDWKGKEAQTDDVLVMGFEI